MNQILAALILSIVTSQALSAPSFKFGSVPTEPLISILETYSDKPDFFFYIVTVKCAASSVMFTLDEFALNIDQELKDQYEEMYILFSLLSGDASSALKLENDQYQIDIAQATFAYQRGLESSASFADLFKTDLAFCIDGYRALKRR